jgi:hypothetical protein
MNMLDMGRSDALALPIEERLSAAAVVAPTEQAPLIVRVGRSGGQPSVRIDAPRPPSFARLVVGKPVEEAARLAGMIFNTCAAAQEGAARAAFGLPPAPGAGARIARESLREHALKLSVAWPRALGLAPDRAALGAVAKLGADHGAALCAALFGPLGPPRRIEQFEEWMAAGDTPAAQVLHHVWTRWDARWARADLPLWRPGAPLFGVDWHAAEIGGGPADVSVAARVADHDLMREVAARRGRGLAWRLVARLVDAQRLIEGLPGGSRDEVPQALDLGIGVAQAARGAMLVQAAVQDGRVVALARLSPTDFALHPHGVLAASLDGLPRGRRAPLQRIAALAIEAVDPCIRHRLVLEEIGGG